jgi:hypothetical protein
MLKTDDEKESKSLDHLTVCLYKKKKKKSFATPIMTLLIQAAMSIIVEE